MRIIHLNSVNKIGCGAVDICCGGSKSFKTTTRVVFGGTGGGGGKQRGTITSFVNSPNFNAC